MDTSAAHQAAFDFEGEVQQPMVASGEQLLKSVSWWLHGAGQRCIERTAALLAELPCAGAETGAVK